MDTPINIYIYSIICTNTDCLGFDLDLSHCPGSSRVVYTCGAPHIAHDSSFLWLFENSLGIPKYTAKSS